jgi:hypothetical protein
MNRLVVRATAGLIAIFVLAGRSYAADDCGGQSFYPPGHATMGINVTGKTNDAGNVVFDSEELEIDSANRMSFSDAGKRLNLTRDAGGDALTLYLDPGASGFTPQRMQIMLYYPVEVSTMPVITMTGPFASSVFTASRDAPNSNDVYSEPGLFPKDWNNIKPGTTITLTVSDQKGALLGKGDFTVPSQPIYEALLTDAIKDFSVMCSPGSSPGGFLFPSK